MAALKASCPLASIQRNLRSRFTLRQVPLPLLALGPHLDLALLLVRVHRPECRLAFSNNRLKEDRDEIELFARQPFVDPATKFALREIIGLPPLDGTRCSLCKWLSPGNTGQVLYMDLADLLPSFELQGFHADRLNGVPF